jgi:methylated-DNA-protein-cysteine methyltransferase-like protein
VPYYEDIQTVVCRIPRGKVATYGEVARAAGYPGTARQVAWALRSASAKGIPWQRVVGAGGRILLPGESRLHQRLLLEMEGVVFSGDRIRMDKCGFRFPAKPDRRDRRKQE